MGLLVKNSNSGRLPEVKSLPAADFRAYRATIFAAIVKKPSDPGRSLASPSSPRELSGQPCPGSGRLRWNVPGSAQFLLWRREDDRKAPERRTRPNSTRARLSPDPAGLGIWSKTPPHTGGRCSTNKRGRTRPVSSGRSRPGRFSRNSPDPDKRSPGERARRPSQHPKPAHKSSEHEHHAWHGSLKRVYKEGLPALNRLDRSSCLARKGSNGGSKCTF